MLILAGLYVAEPLVGALFVSSSDLDTQLGLWRTRAFGHSLGRHDLRFEPPRQRILAPAQVALFVSWTQTITTSPSATSPCEPTPVSSSND